MGYKFFKHSFCSKVIKWGNSYRVLSAYKLKQAVYKRQKSVATRSTNLARHNLNTQQKNLNEGLIGPHSKQKSLHTHFVPLSSCNCLKNLDYNVKTEKSNNNLSLVYHISFIMHFWSTVCDSKIKYFLWILNLSISSLKYKLFLKLLSVYTISIAHLHTD